MIKILPFYLFIISCAWLLIWGMVKPQRVLQYPFFMGSMFVAFLMPQATALVNNPGAAPISSVYRILFYASLCAMMCWLGYGLKPQEQWLDKLDGVPNPKKLAYAGIALSAFGALCFLLLRTISIEKTSTGTWTGPATILIFFSGCGLTGVTILLLHGIYYHQRKSLIMAALAFSPFLPAILESGRRQLTATFFITIALAIFFTYRIIPPRWLVLTLVIATVALIPLIGLMRGGFWDALFSGTLTVAEVRAVSDELQEGKILELRNAALLAEGAEITGRYGYGSGFWNSIVFQYVPGQWFGQQFKSSLYIRLPSFDLQELFNYTTSAGTTITGVGDSFLEFSYFGCLLFGLIAYLFKHLWVSAVCRNSLYSQILYMGLVSPALVAITHGIGRFIQEAIFQFILFIFVFRFSRQNQPIFGIDLVYTDRHHSPP